MKPARNTEKLIKNVEINTNTKMDEAVLDDVLKAFEYSKNERTAKLEPNIWRKIVTSRITQVAAVFIMLSAICLLTLSDKGEPKQHKTTGSEVAVRAKTPSKLLSLVSLNIAFRDGDMEAIEEQLDKAERKTKPKLKERLTIDQLICELGGC